MSIWPSPGDRSGTFSGLFVSHPIRRDDELDIPEESEIEFNYGPKTMWTEEEYL